MSQSRTLVGAVSAGIQVAVSAVVTVFVYTFTKRTVGIEYFGVWSGVIASVAVANLGELGLGGGALRFVARARAFEQPRRAALVVETSMLTALVSASTFALAAFPVAWWGLARIFTGASAEYVPEARALLPVVLPVFVLTALTSVVFSSLDGLEQVRQRSVLGLIGTLILAAAAWWLVPTFGLAGLAMAQLVQQGCNIALGWTALRRHLPTLARFPHRFVRSAAHEVVRFGLGWQAVGWANLLMEPLAKGLAIRLGGVAFGGHFEFALRVAPQVRQIVAAAQQAVTPLFTRLAAQSAHRLDEVYVLSMRATAALVALAQPFLYAGALVVTWIWTGATPSEVVTLLRVILMGGFFSLLGSPAYYFAAGKGDLRPNFVAQLVSAASNVVLAYPLGLLWGGPGVMLGYVIALTTGPLLLVAWHGRTYRVPVTAWLGRPEIGAVGLSIAGVVGTAWMIDCTESVLGVALILAAFTLAVLIWVWRHPLRSRLFPRAL